MKNILIVGPYPPPYGGITNHLVKFSSKLVGMGYGVVVLSFGKERGKFKPRQGLGVARVNMKKEIAGLLDIANIKTNIKNFIYLLRQGLGIKDIVRELTIYCVISKFIKAKTYHCIYSYHLDRSFFIPLVRKNFSDNVVPKIVLMILAELYTDSKLRGKLKDYSKNILDSCNAVLSSSKYCGNSVAEVGYDPSNVEVIYSGVDMKSFTPRDYTDVHEKNIFKVLFVGRFLIDMGLDVVLDVIPSLIAENEKIYFTLAGAAGELSERAKKVAGQFPEHVEIIHDFSYDNLPGLYKDAEILLAPTRGLRACMGLSIKEAMASGVAVIASESGGIGEAVVDGETGIMLKIQENGKVSAHDLKNAILYFMLDPGKCKLMGVMGRKRAEVMFDLKTTLKQNIAVIERLSEYKDREEVNK